MAFSPVEVHDLELTGFKNNISAVTLYREAKVKLKQSGIVEFLRPFARPYTADRGANVYSAAYSAAFCEGYNKALDDLLYFEEQYLDDMGGKKKIAANFGGVGLALKKGDISESDLKGKK